MNDYPNPDVDRRDFLRVLSTGVGVAAIGPASIAVAAPKNADTAKDSKARYQADSPEVQTFYRVNRYPKK